MSPIRVRVPQFPERRELVESSAVKYVTVLLFVFWFSKKYLTVFLGVLVLNLLVSLECLFKRRPTQVLVVCFSFLKQSVG